MDNTKKCGTCQTEKRLCLFPKRRKSKDGYDGRCKLCHSACYKQNIEIRTKYRNRYAEENKDALKIKKTLYSKNHKKEKKIYDVEYRQKNHKKIKLYKANWEEKNKNNPILKIKRNLRRRINHVIKDNRKSDSTMRLLGCSFEEFKNYLESKFLPGMTWDNYGLGLNKWHIDHIRPCCDFDLTKESEQRQCFHFQNTQPLWEKDNLIKSYVYNGKNCRVK